jgi:hypothetical protein
MAPGAVPVARRRGQEEDAAGQLLPQLPNMPSSRTEPNQSPRGRGAPAPQHRHHRRTSTSRSPGSFHRCLRSPFVPTASPDIPISELVSRRTTVETPGSLNPQPARRGRIREDATVPQPSVIPTRTSTGRLSPRAPSRVTGFHVPPEGANGDKAPTTSTSRQRQVGARLCTRNPVAALPASSPNPIEEVVHQASSRDLQRPVAKSDNLQTATAPQDRGRHAATPEEHQGRQRAGR